MKDLSHIGLTLFLYQKHLIITNTKCFVRFVSVDRPEINSGIIIQNITFKKVMD